jgi:adenine-specific DNA methylase
MRVLGIHGDPVASRKRIDDAKRTGLRFEGAAYSYDRAFKYVPKAIDVEWIKTEVRRTGVSFPRVLDPTAGGGSIPLETVRLGFAALANDLNPVASLIQRATVEWPIRHGLALRDEFVELANRYLARREERLAPFFPSEPDPAAIPTNYLWARTIKCTYCDGLIPLSPNWRLSPAGHGIRLITHLGGGSGTPGRFCEFEVVQAAKDHSDGTVTGGDGKCPFPDFGRIVEGDEIRRIAQSGQLGEQLFAVIFKKRIVTRTKAGKMREKWVRGYRAPRLEDDNSIQVSAHLKEKLVDWNALDVIPSESFPVVSNDERPILYGMPLWRDFFAPRQLLGHGTSAEVFSELLQEYRGTDALGEVTLAAFGYLALTIDTMINYGSRSCRWDVVTERVRSIFDRHDFAFVSAYAEMVPLTAGVGYDWAVDKTTKCIEELVALSRPDIDVKGARKHREAPGLFDATPFVAPPISISARSADSLNHIVDASIDAVVMDPPYYDNVMYAELSDFFYVWLKRTAGHVFPELFTRTLTDKQNEAVANPAKFQDQKGAKKLAARDYQERMAAIFAECRRVLKPDGIMTLMFTHKATGAWDALTTGLIEAGFTISASWPINTEAEGSLHIKNKSAANSTIFLACRPRALVKHDDEVQYWEDVEPKVAKAVRSRVEEFQKAGIGGVDLYLASFGPALEEFSKHWPLKRGTPAPQPEVKRRQKQKEMFEEAWDPYAVTPEDALNAARREVKRWRLEQLTHMKTRVELDPATSFFVLAWDAFKAPVFPYDEALRLARAVGVDLDKEIIGRVAEKKGSDVRIWDSSTRAAKHALGPADGSRAWIDTIHHAAHMARLRTLDAAKEMLEAAGVAGNPQFFASFEAVLEVLPVGRTFGGHDLDGELAASGTDFEVLENLRRLAYAEEVDEPSQLEIFKATPA